MAEHTSVQYFLGANSPSGFYSLYDQLLPIEQAKTIYILKGGPGCGKSTLMRRVGRQLEEGGISTEYILCSGDPDSLDGVVFPQLGAAIVDGTAPHVVEPKYPGVVERYVNLGECYDNAALGGLREEIVGCMKGYKGCYQRAYRCLGAAAELESDGRTTLLTPQLTQRLAKKAEGILSREIPSKKGSQPGGVRQRFLSAITHKGPLTLYPTALAQCQRIYELSDRYGLGHDLLSSLLAGATRAGYDVVACPDPMAPERLEHLLIPELSLAFLTTRPGQTLPKKPFRRLHLESWTDRELLRRSRPRLRFAQKVSAALVEEGVSSLAQAKKMHDELEALYNPHVDFDRVGQAAQKVAEELFSLA